MKFNIARQPLVPAFLTLVALAVVAMWKAGATGGNIPAEGALTAAGGELAVATPAELLIRLQAACPGWSRWIGGFLILFVGMSLGRLTVRYNLYSVGTCLAIPLYGAIAAGLPRQGQAFLPILTAAALLTLASKNYARSFCNGYGFDALFRASFYLGLLLLLLPAALPFILLLPLAIALFRRTLRETVVALAGLLLPILAFCYLNWGCGGHFSDPSHPLLPDTDLRRPSSPPPWQSSPEPRRTRRCPPDLVAVFYFLSDIYATGTKSRAIFIFYICLLALTVPAVCNPAAASRHHSPRSRTFRRTDALPFRADSPGLHADRLSDSTLLNGRNRPVAIIYLV